MAFGATWASQNRHTGHRQADAGRDAGSKILLSFGRRGHELRSGVLSAFSVPLEACFSAACDNDQTLCFTMFQRFGLPELILADRQIAQRCVRQCCCGSSGVAKIDVLQISMLTHVARSLQKVHVCPLRHAGCRGNDFARTS